ncbi:uncharacterized protein NDAI_0D03840 [Naumovozyma dairenensis CBS 421]|uniref:Pyridoxamine 5'-phosphate oxidase Alr4036 family FMN-binding domain-containing protein n=1 Tax=Naumovozyma dairenensis (strain ATCC 10597 / BCRC 20456 / CBS 421 / NBRC 0211 / NRRL Y-12639) TaxID=1071378 RepID=G0WA87_NAUDC|nr:hypothetical protein NDAI_0D03840 [Naumovozyma dairenensis CBS 421]CCD24698.1 hypothetical protein NDAI_0D03840 [Naumovozyma dairenensis CBS 421]
MPSQMAPWVPTFIQSCKNNTQQPFTPFQFATIDAVNNLPRVRTVVFRDFLFHDKQTNILTFNSDLRSHKLCGNTASTPFESCFYFPQTWEQYRLTGQCFVISNNKEKNHIPKSIVRKYALFSSHRDCHMQGQSEVEENGEEQEAEEECEEGENYGNDESYEDYEEEEEDDLLCEEDWHAEVKRQWESLSRSSKSLYRKPAPGSPLTTETSKKLDKLQRGVDGAKEDDGLENFGIICLCIDSVDYLNLKDGRGGERWIYKRMSEGDCSDTEAWEEEEVCP